MLVTTFIFREQEKLSFNQMSGIIQDTMQKGALLNFKALFNGFPKG